MPIARGVSYFGNRYPGHARADLQAMAAAGVSYVVHVMTEEDLAWNAGTIGQLVAISHDVGLETWLDPWGVGGVFGGEAASYAAAKHPDACQRTNNGDHRPGLCPRHPAFRDLMERWLDAAAATGTKLCLWDEPHLFILRHLRSDARWSCRCDLCQAAFAERHGAPMPVAFTPEVRGFLENLITETVAWLVAAARERGLDSGVVLLPDEDYYDAAAWRAVAALPGLRTLGTDPYWFGRGDDPDGNRAFVRRWSERTVAATAGRCEAHGWVQAFRVPAGREDEIAWAIDLMLEAGIASVAAWSYRACEAMSDLAADDPARAWQVVTDAFTRLRAAEDAVTLVTVPAPKPGKLKRQRVRLPA